MSTGTILTPAVVTGTTSYQQIGATVPTSKVRSYTLRATNITTADAYANVRINNGTTQGRRAINYPVTYQQSGAAPDLEANILLPAGWYLEVSASAASAIEFTLTGVEDDA